MTLISPITLSTLLYQVKRLKAECKRKIAHVQITTLKEGELQAAEAAEKREAELVLSLSPQPRIP